MIQTCCATKWPNGSYRGVKCHNPAKVERDGKHYCGVHDPVAIKEKQQAKNAKFDAAYEERRKREKAIAAAEAEQKRRANCYEDLLSALIALTDCGAEAWGEDRPCVLDGRAAIAKATGAKQ